MWNGLLRWNDRRMEVFVNWGYRKFRISFVPTQSRWGIVPFIISLGLFAAALAVSFYSAYWSLTAVSPMIASVNSSWEANLFLGLAIAFAALGLAILVLGGMLTIYLLRHQNTEDSIVVAIENMGNKLESKLESKLGDIIIILGRIENKIDSNSGKAKDDAQPT